MVRVLVPYIVVYDRFSLTLDLGTRAGKSMVYRWVYFGRSIDAIRDRRQKEKGVGGNCAKIGVAGEFKSTCPRSLLLKLYPVLSNDIADRGNVRGKIDF